MRALFGSVDAATPATSFAVLWRDPIVAQQLIEAAGGRAVEAARIAEAIRKPGPTVTEVVSEHIDLLTAVGSDTRSHYRQQLAAYIDPTTVRGTFHVNDMYSSPPAMKARG